MGNVVQLLVTALQRMLLSNFIKWITIGTHTSEVIRPASCQECHGKLECNYAWI